MIKVVLNIKIFTFVKQIYVHTYVLSRLIHFLRSITLMELLDSVNLTFLYLHMYIQMCIYDVILNNFYITENRLKRTMTIDTSVNM